MTDQLPAEDPKPESEKREESEKPKTEPKSFIEKMTGTTGQITALLIAVTAMLAAVPPITEGIKTIYCGIRTCGERYPPELPAPDTSHNNLLSRPKEQPTERPVIEAKPNTQITTAPTQQAQLYSAAILNDPPKDGFNPFVINDCSEGTFWVKFATGWDIASTSTFRNPATKGSIVSFFYSSDTDPTNLIAGISKTLGEQPFLVTAREKTSWDRMRWPDGTSTDRCGNLRSRSFSFRINFKIDASIPSGMYNLYWYSKEKSGYTGTSLKIQ